MTRPSDDKIRVLYVGGPRAGRLEITDREVVRVEAIAGIPPIDWIAATDARTLSEEDLKVSKVLYLAHDLVDLDGTRVRILATDDAMVPGPDGTLRPAVTIWGLATTARDQTDRIAELETDLEDARRNARVAYRHTVELSAEIERLRTELAVSANRSSVDD